MPFSVDAKSQGVFSGDEFECHTSARVMLSLGIATEAKTQKISIFSQNVVNKTKLKTCIIFPQLTYGTEIHTIEHIAD